MIVIVSGVPGRCHRLTTGSLPLYRFPRTEYRSTRMR